MAKKKPRPIPQPAPFLAHLVDAHTHLASCGADTPEAVRAAVRRAAGAGVDKICTVGDGLEEAEQALAAAYWDERVYAACAIHPTRAGELGEAARHRLAQMALDPRCVAIGETGIDTYWLRHDPEATAPLEVQEEALRWHADLAARSGKALMIHNREGDEHLLRILDDCPSPPAVILHCFSSPLPMARQAIERGWVLSFAGNVTFKRNEQLREAAALAPSGQLLVETDAPYMTPEPYRGARNEPALVGHTALCVAQARGQAPEELAEEVSRTFDAVYGLRDCG
ncbi:TatD family hydrolase [Corynebacterium sp. zg-331]|uniref:TatD family hydrolase n=1 Tax=unclassified Corynebacterium TaxID=2624378 RepID=UPI00128B5D95|nr:MULTISPECIES: TatD family hydrolase [unclassified Corynebacterium]MBC3186876.1 TatD family hydrolase [Corynebacterium sp. zg-331]MPV53356.1 YchF/TatD family DNA exonuclease [Corynebacterium sp. zg331]